MDFVTYKFDLTSSTSESKRKLHSLEKITIIILCEYYIKQISEFSIHKYFSEEQRGWIIQGISDTIKYMDFVTYKFDLTKALPLKAKESYIV